jgi:hypothetical protein
VNFETPFFKEARKKYQEDKCEDAQLAKPRVIYAAELGGAYHTHVSHQDIVYITVF